MTNTTPQGAGFGSPVVNLTGDDESGAAGEGKDEEDDGAETGGAAIDTRDAAAIEAGSDGSDNEDEDEIPTPGPNHLAFLFPIDLRQQIAHVRTFLEAQQGALWMPRENYEIFSEQFEDPQGIWWTLKCWPMGTPNRGQGTSTYTT